MEINKVNFENFAKNFITVSMVFLFISLRDYIFGTFIAGGVYSASIQSDIAYLGYIWNWMLLAAMFTLFKYLVDVVFYKIKKDLNSK